MSSAASTAETDRFEQSMTHVHAGGYALELRDQALDALRPFDAAAEPLRDLARYIVERGVSPDASSRDLPL